jgi:LysM repeat protein
LPATQTPTPTPTPVVYSIARGDTLSKIAQQFGISVESLLAANPGIQPSQLSVGQTLTIPSSTENPVAGPLSTPVPAELGSVTCFQSVGGLTCLAPVHNSNAEALENVKVEITIFDENGQLIGRQEGALPLDILRPDQTLPASAYFPGIPSANYALSRLLASTLLAVGDKRYIEALLKDTLVSIDWNGNSAQITGQVGLAEGEQYAQSIWVVAVAYDSSGQIVGFRRWDWKGSMKPGEFQSFTLSVYSEGPAIDHIDLQVEARR